MMGFSETQKSDNLALEVEAGKPGSPVLIEGANAGGIIYGGWSAAARPDAVRRLHDASPGDDDRADFASLVDYGQLALVDVDAAVEGHLLMTQIDARSRFDMPVLSDPIWTEMRPRDAEGHLLTWETIKRVKSWLGGAGATITVAALATVSEPSVLALFLCGLLLTALLCHRVRPRGV